MTHEFETKSRQFIQYSYITSEPGVHYLDIKAWDAEDRPMEVTRDIIEHVLADIERKRQ